MTKFDFLQGEGSVMIVLGGAFQGSIPVATSLEFDKLVCIDAVAELANIPETPGVIKLPIGAGETALTLLDSDCLTGYEELVEEVRCLLRDRPGIVLQDGMGQAPVFGFLAAVKLISEPHFGEVMLEVYDSLVTKHNGNPSCINICVAGGGGGGTAAGASEVIAAAATEFLSAKTGAVIDCQMIRVGGASYVGISPRIMDNASATFVRDIDRTVGAGIAKSESRSLVLTELPMRGENRGQREQDGAQLMQSWRAKATQRIIRLLKPNQASESEFGSVVVVRPGYMTTIPARKVAGAVASSFCNELQRLTTAGKHAREVRNIHMHPASEAQDAFTPDQLVELVNSSTTSAGILETVVRPVAIHSAAVTARLNDGVVVDPRHVGDSFPACYEIREFARKFAACRAIVARLHELKAARLDDCEGDFTVGDRIAELLEERKQAVTRTKTAINAIFPQTTLRKFFNMGGSPQARLDEFHDATAQFQQIDDELRRHEAQQAAIESALEGIEDEMKAEHTRLKRVSSLLRPLCLVRQHGQSEPLVTAGCIDHALQDLLAFAMRPESEENEGRLISQLTMHARAVTLAGLKEITGASSASAEEIAAILADWKPKTLAPVWGMTRPQSEGKKIIVLPPLESSVQRMISDHFKQTGKSKGINLVCSDTAQGGVNIVFLEIWKPTRFEDICDRPLLNRIMASSDRISMPTGDADEFIAKYVSFESPAKQTGYANNGSH